MERWFQISRRGSSVRLEVVGGLTTFFAMAYIIFVNPNTLCANLGTEAEAFYPAMPGELWGPVLVATCIAAAIGSILTGLLANVPFAQAPGMGLNAFFTYTVCLGMGYTWQEGLAVVFLSGLLFLIITISPVREKLMYAIPDFLKHAISAGIGLFIALIGLMNVGLVSIQGAVPALQLFMSTDAGKVWNMQGLMAIFGLLLTGILMVYRVKGAVVIGIVATTLLGIPLGQTHMPETWTMAHMNLAPVFMQMDFAGAVAKGILPLLTAVVSFAMIDCFDTLGALVGLSANATMPNKEEKLEKLDRALVADAMATCLGACVGTSTVTTYAESSTGIAEGARTGLSSVVVGIMFLVCVVLAPVAGVIPSAATAPALIIVGVLTMGSVVSIAWNKLEVALPAFLTIAGIPFFYSISDGIAIGFFSYCVVMLAKGKGKEVSGVIYVVTALFLVKYILNFIAV